jgi:type IV secretion system protein VirB5
MKVKNFTKKFREGLFMKTIKHFVVGLGILVAMSSGSYGQIPVSDGAQIGQNFKDMLDTGKTWLTEAERWEQTIEEYAKQLEAYKKELETKIGDKNVGGLIDMAISAYQEVKELKKLFKELENIANNGNLTLVGKAAEARDKLEVYHTCDQLTDDQAAQKACSYIFDSKFAQVGQVEEIVTKILEASTKLEDLANRMKSSQDIKETQDLANAANALQMSIQSKKVALDTYIQNQEIERQKRVDMLQQYVTKTQTQGKDLGEFGGSGSSSPHSADDDD